MMTRLRIAGLVLAPLSLALLVASAQASVAMPPPGSKAKQVGATIWRLAMDGPRVAYAAGGRVYVWNVVTGATSVVKGQYSNAAHNVNPAQLAIAGTRVAWIKREGFGNTEVSEKLYTASISGRVHLLMQGYRVGRDDPSRTTGDWIGGVVGSGKVLAVSTWKSNGTVSSNERLRLITPTGLRPIVSGPGAIVAVSAARGRVAVLRSTAAWPADEPGTPTTQPSVGVYSAQGTLLREIVLSTPIPLPPAGYYYPTILNSVALSGNRVVVLTETNRDPEPDAGAPRWDTTLQVYNSTTGTLVHSWPIAITPEATNRAAPLAAYGRFAAIEGARRLHLVDLTTGKDVLTAPSSGTDCPAAIGPRGLVYAPEGSLPWTHSGQLIFVPMAKLLRAAPSL
jgi:hypothetical protein